MEIIKTSEPFKIGYLQIPPQGFLKKSWPKKFYALYEASDDGVQRLEVFENEENFYRKSSNKIVPLTDCIKVTTVTQKHQNNLFEVVTKTQTYLFSAESHQEMNDWVSAFRNVAFGSTSTLKSIQPLFNSTDSILSSSSSTINEENTIYSSVDAPEVYVVKVEDCEVRNRLKLHSTYHLLVTSVGISLTEIGVPSQKKPSTLTWAYRHIRRYGYSNDTFSFEAGRKSASGEGLFVFGTKDGAAIFQSTASHVNLLKSSRTENDLALMDEKKKFVPGTSPKNCSSPNFHSNDNKTTENRNKPPPPLNKPPRKPKPSLSDSSCETSHTYEELASSIKARKKSASSVGGVEFFYDLPEERTEAWKMYGRDVDDAYESDSNDPGYECVSVMTRKKSSETANPVMESTYAIIKGKNKETTLERIQSLRPLSEPRRIQQNEDAESTSPYENVFVDKQPPHFMFNDTEYAQVNRKKL